MKRSFLLLFLVITAFAEAQDRYFVSFKDKANSTFTVSNPAAFLSSKSIARRTRLGISITEEDLPVNATYVAQVKATGAKTFYTSKWWNGVLIQADATTATTIAALPFVSKIERVANGTKLLNGRKASKTNVENESATSQVTDFQLTQLGIDRMQSDNYLGQNINIAQFDSGWKGVNLTTPFAHLINSGRIKETKNFVRNTTDVYTDDTHGTAVLSVMAGLVSGSFTGGIYMANFYLYETEDKLEEYRVEEYNWTFAAERADSIGVDVVNSSLGYNQFDDSSMDYTKANLDGKTSVISNAARKLISKGIVVVSAAGNEGSNAWQTIMMPADTDGIIAVGSITNNSFKSSFSSIGPAADGRIKPDVVAFGSGTSTINSTGNLNTTNGTSVASPLITSLVAGLVQAFPKASPQQIYQAIIYSASQYEKPDNQLGYGIPNYNRAKSYLTYGKLTKEISIYPNPVKSLLLVLFKEPTGQPVTISLSDYFGRRLINYTGTTDWSANPLQVDVSSLPNGMYILEVTSGGITEVMKVMKI
ncbi:MAG: S8 family serine peptidase [Cyclobacteriaceae bacterium]|nr:S8 family serine peptidase [Cyclobacteriaceae bacterium]